VTEKESCFFSSQTVARSPVEFLSTAPPSIMKLPGLFATIVAVLVMFTVLSGPTDTMGVPGEHCMPGEQSQKGVGSGLIPVTVNVT